MTFTAAHNYQREPLTRGTCSPNLIAVRDYIVDQFGGQPLGCYSPRPIRGGTTPSTHWSGAAVDIRYSNVGAGYRNVPFPGALIDWIIDQYQTLGIQQLHDYAGARIWKVGRGWKRQATSPNGMGQSWALWLHLETHPTRWNDSTPVAERGARPQPQPVPDPQPELQMKANITATLDVLRRGDAGRDVKRLQGLLAALWFPVGIDGHYGPQTEANVISLQKFMNLTVDGIVGPQTWTALIDR